jgi:hypothetical protein
MKCKVKKKSPDGSHIDKIEKQEKTMKKKIKTKNQNVHVFQMNENRRESSSIVNEQTESNNKKSAKTESVEDDVIANIFKKGKLVNQKKQSSSKEKQQVAKSKQNEKADKEDDDFAQMRGPQKRKKTTEGFHIYTVEELNIGKGGNTDLCPFDCNCCF